MRTTVAAFAISGFMAAAAGVLFVHEQNGLGSTVFAPTESLKTFSTVVIGGLGSFPGAVLGSVYVRGAQYFLNGNWQLVATGAGVLLILWIYPGGLGGMAVLVRDAYLRWVADRRGHRGAEPAARRAGRAPPSPSRCRSRTPTTAPSPSATRTAPRSPRDDRAGARGRAHDRRPRTPHAARARRRRRRRTGAEPSQRWRQALGGGAPLYPLLVLFGLTLVDQLDKRAFSVLLPDIAEDLHLSTGSALDPRRAGVRAPRSCWPSRSASPPTASSASRSRSAARSCGARSRCSPGSPPPPG